MLWRTPEQERKQKALQRGWGAVLFGVAMGELWRWPLSKDQSRVGRTCGSLDEENHRQEEETLMRSEGESGTREGGDFHWKKVGRELDQALPLSPQITEIPHYDCSQNSSISEHKKTKQLLRSIVPKLWCFLAFNHSKHLSCKELLIQQLFINTWLVVKCLGCEHSSRCISSYRDRSLQLESGW